MNRDELRPGDRVWRWWDSGAFGAERMPMTVIRVNQVTATVRADNGNEGRIRFHEIEGHITDDE